MAMHRCFVFYIFVVVIDREVVIAKETSFSFCFIKDRAHYILRKLLVSRKEIYVILPNEAVSLRVISYAYTREYVPNEQRGRH